MASPTLCDYGIRFAPIPSIPTSSPSTRSLKDRFGSDVVLVQSTDFGKQQSYPKKPADEPMWVTIYDPGTFSSKGEAAAWCSDAFNALSGKELRNACYPRQAVPPHG